MAGNRVVAFAFLTFFVSSSCKGPAGPARVLGVSGYEIVTQSFTADSVSNALVTASVNCPGTKKVLGGGVGTLLVNGSSTVVVSSSGPFQANNSPTSHTATTLDHGWTVHISGKIAKSDPIATTRRRYLRQRELRRTPKTASQSGLFAERRDP